MDKTLSRAVRNTLEAAISATSVVLRAYADDEGRCLVRDGLRAVRSLRSVDRLLVVLVTGGGALEDESVVRVAWAIGAAKACIQAYGARLLFEAGRQTRASFDPDDHSVTDASFAPVRDAQGTAEATATLSALHRLLTALNQVYRTNEHRAIDRRELEVTLDEIMCSCERALSRLARCVQESSSGLPATSFEAAAIDGHATHALRDLLVVDTTRAAEFANLSASLRGLLGSPEQRAPSSAWRSTLESRQAMSHCNRQPLAADDTLDNLLEIARTLHSLQGLTCDPS